MEVCQNNIVNLREKMKHKHVVRVEKVSLKSFNTVGIQRSAYFQNVKLRLCMTHSVLSVADL